MSPSYAGNESQSFPVFYAVLTCAKKVILSLADIEFIVSQIIHFLLRGWSVKHRNTVVVHGKMHIPRFFQHTQQLFYRTLS